MKKIAWMILFFSLGSVFVFIPHVHAAYSVSGTVYYSTTPLDDVQVDLIQDDLSNPPLHTMNTVDGFYSFSSVDPGYYYLKVYGPTPEYISWSAMSFEVTTSDVVLDYYLKKLMTLISPADGSYVYNLHPTLTWEPILEAFSYTVQVNVMDTWETVVFEETQMTEYTIPVELTPGVEYVWQIDARNSLGFPIGTTETTFSFTVLSLWWPMFHHDLAHTGYSTSKAPATNNILWTYATGDMIYFSSPAVLDGYVYIHSSDHKVYCLDADTGLPKWTYPTECWTPEYLVADSPAVAYGKVYVGSSGFGVYCLDANTGEEIWNFAEADLIFASPTVSDGKVYVGSSDTNVYCLDADTGSKIWNYPTNLGIHSSAAVVDGRVYVGSDDTNVYCLDADTGSKIWNYPTNAGLTSSPAVVDGRVYVGSDDTNVYCLDADDGSFIWDFPTGGSVFSSPAVADGRVYVGSNDNNFYCLDADDGSPLWVHPTGENVGSSPAVADGKVYVGSWDSKIYCLDAVDGSPIWDYSTGGVVKSSPAVVDGRVYVGSYDNKVYCFSWDVDDDGIVNEVDTQPEVYSNEFSDVTLGGTTTGTITDRGDQIVTVTEESNPAGVRIKTDHSGGVDPAVIFIDGESTWIYLDAGEEVVVNPGSVTIQVITGTVEITFIAEDGTPGTTTLEKGNCITFDPETFTLTAGEGNLKEVIVMVEGQQYVIQPGESVTILVCLPADIDIDPDTLNLKSKGKWITCYIELHEDYDVADIDVTSILLNGEIQAEESPTNIDDYDEDGVPDLMIKFSRSDLIDVISEGNEVELILTGSINEVPFEGSDTIKVINKGKK